MIIEVIKAVNNKKYVSRKDENYYPLSWGTKRIWLKEEMGIVPDSSVIYECCFKNGLTVEGKLLGKGTDEIGFYIIFNMDSFNLDNDIDIVK